MSQNGMKFYAKRRCFLIKKGENKRSGGCESLNGVLTHFYDIWFEKYFFCFVSFWAYCFCQQQQRWRKTPLIKFGYSSFTADTGSTKKACTRCSTRSAISCTTKPKCRKPLTSFDPVSKKNTIALSCTIPIISRSLRNKQTGSRHSSKEELGWLFCITAFGDSTAGKSLRKSPVDSASFRTVM